MAEAEERETMSVAPPASEHELHGPASRSIDAEKKVRVVVLEQPVESGFTEKNLREWSLDFSRPTVVRNAFTPPKLDDDGYKWFLPEKTKLHANVGQIGHFQDGNGSYIWSELWRMMKDGKNVYGSYGTGTSNGGMDMGDECLNKNPFSESIRELRDKFLPTGMGVKSDYPGHVIFGCSTKMKVSSNWQYVSHHITKGTFQLYGNKEWYTCENLPEGFAPLQVANHANSVVPEEDKLNMKPNITRVTRKLNDIFENCAHVTLQPGDMLINPPFSWHAIKVDQMSISLSLRGDKEDVVSWLACRYFGGNLDHPLLLTFSSFFMEYNYMKLKWSNWNYVFNFGQWALLSLAFKNPQVILQAYAIYMEKAIKMRKAVLAYFERYDLE